MDNKLGHEYICNICNKNYSNYNSLWKHNKRFHKNINKQKNINKKRIGFYPCFSLCIFCSEFLFCLCFLLALFD